MKDDLIYRKDAIKLIENTPYDWNNLTQRTKMIHSFESLPAAERNCFTCGMVDRVMEFNPEKVSDEILEENDRPVMLSDVCKLIQEEWEVNPKQWGKIRSLPSVNDGRWIPCDERLPKNSDLIFITEQNFGGKGKEDAPAKNTIVHTSRYDVNLKKWRDQFYMDRCSNVTAWMPTPEPYNGSSDKTVGYANFKITPQGRRYPLVYCECGRQIATTRKDKYCPKCGKKINEEEIRRKCLEVMGR